MTYKVFHVLFLLCPPYHTCPASNAASLVIVPTVQPSHASGIYRAAFTVGWTSSLFSCLVNIPSRFQISSFPQDTFLELLGRGEVPCFVLIQCPLHTPIIAFNASHSFIKFTFKHLLRATHCPKTRSCPLWRRCVLENIYTNKFLSDKCEKCYEIETQTDEAQWMRSTELSADEVTRKLYLEGQAGLTRGREKGKNDYWNPCLHTCCLV